jgi:hypothetical protein
MDNEQATWQKAARKLKREVRLAHKSEDISERKTFRKKRKQLRRLARKEQIAIDHLTDAEVARVTSFAIYMLEN